MRVLPGESLGDSFGFAGEKKGRYALAEFYRRTPDRSYRLIAEATLPNPVAPVDFFVADSGHLAALELFQPDEIQGFPHSVSSIHWREGPMYVRPAQKTLLITLKAGGDFLFGLETGQFKYGEYPEKVYRCRTRISQDNGCPTARCNWRARALSRLPFSLPTYGVRLCAEASRPCSTSSRR